MSTSSELEPLLPEVASIELRGLALGEFVLDAGAPPSLTVDGEGAEAVRLSVAGGTLKIEGDAAPRRRRGASALQVSGSYVTGAPAIPPPAAGTDPLRIRAAGGGLRIRVALPPGQAVTIRSDYGTFSTRAPLAGAARQEALAAGAAERRQRLLDKAAARREKARVKLADADAAAAAGKTGKAERKRGDAQRALAEADDLERQARGES